MRAGRSSTLARLPTARGTVAPTRGQVPGGVLLDTLNLVVEAVEVRGWLVDPGGVWGVQASSASEFRDQGA